jgi:hypothetical protein
MVRDRTQLTAIIRAVTASVLGFIMSGSSAIAFSSFARKILVRSEYRWASVALPLSSLYSMQSSNRTPNTNTRLIGPHSFGWLNVSSHFCFRGIIEATGKKVRNRLSGSIVSNSPMRRGIILTVGLSEYFIDLRTRRGSGLVDRSIPQSGVEICCMRSFVDLAEHVLQGVQCSRQGRVLGHYWALPDCLLDDFAGKHRMGVCSGINNVSCRSAISKYDR